MALKYLLPLPALLFGIVLMFKGKRLPASAFLLYACGDFAGVSGWFLPQMGLFAAGHLLLVSALLYRLRLRRAADDPDTVFSVHSALLRLLPALGLILLVILVILPHTQGLMAVLVAAYSALLLLALTLGLFCRSRLLTAGFLLFVASDLMIASGRFVASLPHSSALVCGTYVAALVLLFAAMLYNTSRPMSLR